MGIRKVFVETPRKMHIQLCIRLTDVVNVWCDAVRVFKLQTIFVLPFVNEVKIAKIKMEF